MIDSAFYREILTSFGARPRLTHRLRTLARVAFHTALPIYRQTLPSKMRAAIPDAFRHWVSATIEVSDLGSQVDLKSQVRALKRRLNDLGFVNRAEDDLIHLTECSHIEVEQRAAWELAVWHANRRSPEGSVAALKFLDKGVDFIATPDNIRRREAILRAECYQTLGDVDTGRAVVEAALGTEQHADLYLAAANLCTSAEKRIAEVNKALALYGIPPVSLREDDNLECYDRLTFTDKLPRVDGPKITIIIPAFDASDHIITALEALSAQTWVNFEVLVVDDRSTDDTASIVTAFSQRDPRFRLIRAEVNGGSYVARNIALCEASGDFVTTHDSDDWSHPKKLEIQVRHLLNTPAAAANMSQQARSTNDLVFHRRGNPGHYIFDNMSSLMFRREGVLNKLGFWDSVRFGADSEFIERIRLAFGPNSVVSLDEAGPLSFQRQLESSLTGSSVFGYHGFLMGARLAYHQSSRRYHSLGLLRYEFPQTRRPFAVPEPMLPKREVAKGARRAFDIVLVADFRVSGRVREKALTFIATELQERHRIGLVQMACYHVEPTRKINKVFRDLEDSGVINFLVPGERISCDRLVVLHASVLDTFQCFVPDLEPGMVEIFLDEIPVELDTSAAFITWLKACRENAKQYFGDPGEWSSAHPKLNALLKSVERQGLSAREEERGRTSSSRGWRKLS